MSVGPTIQTDFDIVITTLMNFLSHTMNSVSEK